MSEKLLNEARDIECLEFADNKEKKHYLYELSQKIESEQFKIMEKIRKLEDTMSDLRIAESKVYEYYLNIK